VLQTETTLGWCHGYQTLCYEEGAIIGDVGRLKSILELFNEMLNHLCHIGSATKDDPHCML
jgi:phosphoribosylformylglycinamidine (FGAM) synthase-like amidotransferase family enzyme